MRSLMNDSNTVSRGSIAGVSDWVQSTPVLASTGTPSARQYLAQSEAEGPGLTGMALLSRAALTAPAFKTPRPGAGHDGGTNP